MHIYMRKACCRAEIIVTWLIEYYSGFPIWSETDRNVYIRYRRSWVRIRVTPDKLLGSHLNELIYTQNMTDRVYIYIYIYIYTHTPLRDVHYLYIYISLTACAVWALSWIGWRGPLWGTFTICTMHRSLFAVWALWWLHNAIQTMCKRTSRVPSAGVAIEPLWW